VSLSAHRLVLTRNGRVILRTRVAVGSRSSPTPRGRFFVTDRVRVPLAQPQFGQYAIGLSGVQHQLPEGWAGGNQLAIHGTNEPQSMGKPVSAGCIRVAPRALQLLWHHVRRGTPVRIQP
jgi:lipoprotein-anchoring transpeptidase ErfK/SrfK